MELLKGSQLFVTIDNFQHIVTNFLYALFKVYKVGEFLNDKERKHKNIIYNPSSCIQKISRGS